MWSFKTFIKSCALMDNYLEATNLKYGLTLWLMLALIVSKVINPLLPIVVLVMTILWQHKVKNSNPIKTLIVAYFVLMFSSLSPLMMILTFMVVRVIIICPQRGKPIMGLTLIYFLKLLNSSFIHNFKINDSNQIILNDNSILETNNIYLIGKDNNDSLSLIMPSILNADGKTLSYYKNPSAPNKKPKRFDINSLKEFIIINDKPIMHTRGT